MILLAAYEFRHAEYYAREVLKLRNNKEWRFVKDQFDVQGLRRAEITIVMNPRHRPSGPDLEKMYQLQCVCRCLDMQIREVFLP